MRAIRICSCLTIATFLGFFVVEALLWTVPIVAKILVPQLNPDLAVPVPEQAVVLRALFVNQGFYNLFAAASGVLGLVELRRGRTTLVAYNFVFGLGAAVTLLTTTHAYALGLVQAVFPLFGLVLLLRGRTSAP